MSDADELATELERIAHWRKGSLTWQTLTEAAALLRAQKAEISANRFCSCSQTGKDEFDVCKCCGRIKA